MRVALLALSCLAALSCGDPAHDSAPPPAPVAPAPVESAPAATRSAPAPAPGFARTPEGALRPTQLALPAGARAPARGCVYEAERVLTTPARRVLLARDGGTLTALVIAPDGRALTLLRGPGPGSLAQAAQHSLEQPEQRTTLVSDSLGLRMVWVDAAGRVQLAALTAREFAPARLLAEGADRRFAPAYAVHEQRELVAFTRTVDEAMHTFLARVSAARVVLEDLTPASHGAAAPSFVLGARPLRLVAIDARAGVSPLLELPLARGGAALVRTPVSQPYTPPFLLPVLLASGDVQVAYTAVGKLAASAVGRVSLTQAGEPLPLLPSRGYGELALAVARGERRAVFAMESPRSETPDAPRSLEVKLLDGEGEGPALLIAGEGPSARFPSLALGTGPGELWLGFVRDGNPVITTLRCDL